MNFLRILMLFAFVALALADIDHEKPKNGQNGENNTDDAKDGGDDGGKFMSKFLAIRILPIFLSPN
ncbi:hypothetical protein Bhyg_08888, partial [Pseudolycoriella hygida]